LTTRTPVDCDDDVLLGQTRVRIPESLVEPRKQQQPLELGVRDDVPFHCKGWCFLFYVVSLQLSKKKHQFNLLIMIYLYEDKLSSFIILFI
jgi:hypothetical protein